MSAEHRQALEALMRRGRFRHLEPAEGRDFTSNDYLGLASSVELRAAVLAAIDRGVPVGAGGSRLLRGNHVEHEALEAEAAAFFGAEAALYFGGGFAANTAIFSTLPMRGDLIVHDELVHASTHEGMNLSKAGVAAARHNDPQSFVDRIVAWRKAGGTGRPWIAVETLYSMDGDLSPLDDLTTIAAQHDAMLVLDEAHATGVLGNYGRGLGTELEGRENVISLHTCGKALGASGALVLSSRLTRNFLINRARAFIYATAPSPLMAAAVRAALEISSQQGERRERLASLVTFAGRELHKFAQIQPTGTQIQPILTGTDARAIQLAAALKGRGFDVRAIRPPTVPEGTARLRITLTLNVSEGDITSLFTAIAEEKARLAA